MAKLMLSVMGAIHEFDRALIKERQREGIALAKKRVAFKGRKKSLSQAAVDEMHNRIAAGISRACRGISIIEIKEVMRAPAIWIKALLKEV